MHLSLSTTPEQAIDRQALAGLAAVAGDDPLFLKEMIGLFLAQAPRYLEALRNAWVSRDPIAIGKAAHQVKSASFYLGARRLSELCAQTETSLRDGNASAVTDLITAIMLEFEMVQRGLREIEEHGGKTRAPSGCS